MVVVMIIGLIMLPAVSMTNSPLLSAQPEQKRQSTIISACEQPEKPSFAEKLWNFKIGFNCHVEAEGFGDCSVLFLKSLSESTYSAKWMHMWFYSGAEIIVDDWHHSGKASIYMVGYNGRYEFDDATHTYILNGNASFCFAIGKE